MQGLVEKQRQEVPYSPKSPDRFWGQPSVSGALLSNFGYPEPSAEHTRIAIPLTYTTRFLRVALIKPHKTSLCICSSSDYVSRLVLLFHGQITDYLHYQFPV